MRLGRKGDIPLDETRFAGLLGTIMDVDELNSSPATRSRDELLDVEGEDWFWVEFLFVGVVGGGGGGVAEIDFLGGFEGDMKDLKAAVIVDGVVLLLFSSVIIIFNTILSIYNFILLCSF